MTPLGRCFVSTVTLTLVAGCLCGAALARANDGYYFDAVLLGAFAWVGAHLARVGFRRLIGARWGFD